nr:hypothetical protein Ade03nite_10060 [Actinoplanes derwentensis]
MTKAFAMPIPYPYRGILAGGGQQGTAFWAGHHLQRPDPLGVAGQWGADGPTGHRIPQPHHPIAGGGK